MATPDHEPGDESSLSIQQFMQRRGLAGGVALDGQPAEGATGSLSGTKRYQVGKVVAKGGMGAILDARDLNIRRGVAMKVLLDGPDAHDDQVIRFIEEAQVTGQLEHPNIVPVHELGVDSEGAVYYTMKFVQGRNLRDVLGDLRKGKAETIKEFPLTRLLSILLKACDAVAFAHARGVVHRDLKPENIMLGDYGEVLVMDWGLAKIVGRGSELRVGTSAEPPTPGPKLPAPKAVESSRQEKGGAYVTMEGQVMGTPAFMAPEQAYGQISAIDARTDIYALGGILYNILTLHPPIEGRSAHEMLIKAAQGEITPPSVYSQASAAKHTARELATRDLTILHHCPGRAVPEALAAVAMKALALAREDRYLTVKALQEDLERWQGGFATAAEGAGLLRQGWLLLRRHRQQAALVGVSLAVLAAVVLGAFLKTNAARRVAERNEQRARQAETAAVTAQEALAYQAYVGGIAAAETRGRDQNFDAARQVLAECPAPFRGWEWGYFQRQCHLDLKTVAAHPGGVGRVVMSPDQRRLASIGADQTIHVWDADTGAPLQQIALDCKSGGLTFSPNGQQLLSGAIDGAISVWNSQTGQRLQRFPAHPGADPILGQGVQYLGFTADGRQLVSSGVTGNPRVWDAATYRELGNLPVADGMCICCVDRFVIVLQKRELSAWDVATRQKVRTIRTLPAGIGVTAGGPAPDGRAFATFDTGFMLRLWDVATWTARWEIKLDDTGYGLGFSPDGQRLAVGMFDNPVRILEAATGNELAVFRGHSRSVSAVVFLRDGRRLVSASGDGTLRWWDTARSSENLRLKLPAFWAVGFVPGRPEVVLAGTRELQLRASDSGDLRRQGGTAGTIMAMAFSADGSRLLAGSTDHSVQLWDARELRLLATLSGHAQEVRSVGLSADGRWGFTLGTEGVAILWDLAARKEVRRFIGNHQFFARAAISAAGDRLALATDGKGATLWDRASGQEVGSVGRSTGFTSAVAFSADGRLIATGDESGLARVWETASGRELTTMSGHGALVIRAAFSPDGKRLLTSSIDQTIKLWDVRTGRELMTLARKTNWCRSGFAFSSDGRQIVLGDGLEHVLVLTAVDWQ